MDPDLTTARSLCVWPAGPEAVGGGGSAESPCAPESLVASTVSLSVAAFVRSSSSSGPLLSETCSETDALLSSAFARALASSALFKANFIPFFSISFSDSLIPAVSDTITG